MVAILEKSDAAEGFEQIIDFLSGSYINHALTVNPHVYISCIKQCWNTAVVKHSGDITRLQGLVDKKRIVIVREILQLNDAEEEVANDVIPPTPTSPSPLSPVIPSPPPHQSPCPPQPQDAEGSSHLFQQVLDTCSALSHRVEVLENDKVAQQLEIVKLKARVKKLEKINKGRIVVDMDQDEGIELVVDQEKDAEEHDEAYKHIDWNAALDHVQSKEPQYIKRYHGIKKKPQSESKARKNMISYLKNTKGYKMEFLKGKTYDEILPIFQARLEIVQDKDDDVFVEATPLAQKVPVVDYQVVVIDNKPKYKIIRADDTHQFYISFTTLLKNFDKEDLETLWRIVRDIFSTSKPTNFLDEYLLLTLKTMFGELYEQDPIWRNKKSVHGLALVKR
nr:hypothetical protein [Tanacetum cinerariifolium]